MELIKKKHKQNNGCLWKKKRCMEKKYCEHHAIYGERKTVVEKSRALDLCGKPWKRYI